MCGARHSGRDDCTRQAKLVEDVERLSERHYETVQITKQTRYAIGAKLHAASDEPMASEGDALAAMATERSRWEEEQLRVLQAHDAGAVPLDLLKKEQDRISAALETIEHRITAHHGAYADARANLDYSLDLLEHAAEVYARCDDANRRLCNQAFFTAIYIDGDHDATAGYATPFDALIDRELQTVALAWAEDARNKSEARTSTGSTVESSHLAHLG